MSNLPKWVEEKESHPAANWKCKCGRGPSLEHSIGGYCEARLIIERLENALSIAGEALKRITSDCSWYDTAQDALRRIEELGK